MPDLAHFIHLLERNGELARVRIEADPELEISEIATRIVKEKGPALLFERVKGSRFPLLINLLGNERRIELALGRHPQEIGNGIRKLIESAIPPRPKKLLGEWRSIGRVLASASKISNKTLPYETDESCDIDALPIMKCWPKDAGRFLTSGMVLTYDVKCTSRNLGIYRMQVIAKDRILMHWQIQKGGGFHYWEAMRQEKQLPVCVIIGSDPILYLAAASPLPEGIDEFAFAGYLRGRKFKLSKGKSNLIPVPSGAEFVMEGVVMPGDTHPEGPFGDHFGHYSHPKPCAVMRIHSISHRRDPIYCSSVVGKPPQEDKYIGNAVQEMLLPMIRLLHPELKDLWAYYEAGFHSLVAASVIQRFSKEAMKTALGLLGTGQMSLTKCIVMVDEGINPRDFSGLLGAIRDHFEPSKDFLLLPGVPSDTLDFTSFTTELGSKMIIDATGPKVNRVSGQSNLDFSRIMSREPRIKEVRCIEDCLLAVKVTDAAREILEYLVKDRDLGPVKIIAAVSLDVELKDIESLLWGIFTRFDPGRDLIFEKAEFKGIRPVYKGRMGIDATFKQGYPEPVVMDPEIIRLVDIKWNRYWKA